MNDDDGEELEEDVREEGLEEEEEGLEAKREEGRGEEEEDGEDDEPEDWAGQPLISTVWAPHMTNVHTAKLLVAACVFVTE